METTQKLNYTIEDLQNGKKITCSKCHKGIYKPFNPDYKVNHVFICDNCGTNIIIEPMVEIK